MKLFRTVNITLTLKIGKKNKVDKKRGTSQIYRNEIFSLVFVIILEKRENSSRMWYRSKVKRKMHAIENSGQEKEKKRT